MGGSRQFHFRIPESDHEFLKSLARKNDETVGAVLRRLVRRLRVSSGPLCVNPTQPNPTQPAC
jgi:hypothetical protein